MESKKTVLIADTSEEFRAILADALKGEEGLEVIGQTGDGQEAIRLAQELTPDILVMDLVLGRVDGFDVLDAIRTTGQLSKETEEALKAALDAYTRDFLKGKQ